MLSKEVFKKGIQELVYAFPSWNMDYTNPEVLLSWYQRFSTYTDDEFIRIIESYIDKEKFNPTISGLKEYYRPGWKVKEFD